MKLDRHGTENGANPAVVLNEVKTLSGDCRLVNCSFATHVFAIEQGYEAELSQVVKVPSALLLVSKVNHLIRSIRVAIPEVLKHFSLKLTTQFHMPGLRDRRFEWNQNDITAWPGTHLRPG